MPKGRKLTPEVLRTSVKEDSSPESSPKVSRSDSSKRSNGLTKAYEDHSKSEVRKSPRHSKTTKDSGRRAPAKPQQSREVTPPPLKRKRGHEDKPESAAATTTPQKGRISKDAPTPVKKEISKSPGLAKDDPDPTADLDGSKPKKKRKTKEEKEAEEMPLSARTNGLRMFIGAHVSCAKGVQNSVTNCVHIGGNAFAMFLKSQRKWDNPPLQDEHRDQFKARCTEYSYDASQHVLPHGSYLVNLAQADSDKAAQAYAGFIDDLKRCDDLGIKYYNFHPGTTGGNPRPAAISRIAAAINKAHGSTRTVVPVLETMATAGSNVVGSTFEDIRDIIGQVKEKDRVGVCIDTCHVFAAGYDLRDPKDFAKTLEMFDNIVGMRYLKALHLNDSKAPLGAARDLHQNIGLGFLGLRAFHNVVNEKRFEGLPMVLETPIDKKDANGKEVEDKGVWATEIKLLESLIGMNPDSEEFKSLEKDLSAKGAEERQKYQEAYERKKEKAEKGQTKLSFGKRKKKQTETDSE